MSIVLSWQIEAAVSKYAGVYHEAVKDDDLYAQAHADLYLDDLLVLELCPDPQVAFLGALMLLHKGIAKFAKLLPEAVFDAEHRSVYEKLILLPPYSDRLDFIAAIADKIGYSDVLRYMFYEAMNVCYISHYARAVVAEYVQRETERLAIELVTLHAGARRDAVLMELALVNDVSRVVIPEFKIQKGAK